MCLIDYQITCIPIPTAVVYLLYQQETNIYKVEINIDVSIKM